MESEMPRENLSETFGRHALRSAGRFARGLCKVALFTTTALVAPFGWDAQRRRPRLDGAKLLIWSLAPLLAYQSARFAPTAEEYFTQRGYDPALVEKLAGRKDMHVLTDDVFGKTQAFFSGSLAATVAGQNGAWSRMTDDRVVGLAMRGGVTVIRPNVLYIKENLIRGSLPDPKDASMQMEYVTLHETRHFAADNVAGPEVLAGESDADYHAYISASPRTREWIRHRKSGLQATTHDTILYIDAMEAGGPVPSWADMRAANRLAKDRLSAIFNAGVEVAAAALYCHGGVREGETCRWTIDGAPMPALAQRRFALHMDFIVNEQAKHSAAQNRKDGAGL